MVGPVAPRVFLPIAGRLNQQATPVASADDIRRAITLCLSERRPCVLTMTDNIPLDSTLTLPGGLRAFSIDGGGRWAFILSDSMLFAIRSRGAQDANGFPVEFSNLSFRTKAGVTVQNLLGVDQYDTGQMRQRTTLAGVEIDTTAAGSSIPVVVKMSGVGFVASVDLLDVSIVGSATTVWGGDVDPKTWEYCEVKRLNVNTATASSWTNGFGFEPSFIGAVSLVTGTINVVVTAGFGAWSFQDSNVSTYSNASASTEVTLLRVVAPSRTVGPVDVDLDNISGGGGGGTTITAATITVPYGLQEQTVTVVDASCTAASRVIVSWGATLPTDENQPGAGAVTFSAVPAAGSLAITVSSDNADPVGGTYKILYTLG